MAGVKSDGVSRRKEWILQSEFAELLTEYLDPRCAWFTSLENKPLSRISGFLQKRRHVKSGLPDVLTMYRRKPSPRCPTHVVFVELKAPGGVASKSQKRTRLEMLPTGAKWWTARTARAALMALHLEGVPFRRKYKPPKKVPAWEGPFTDPTQRLPQHPEVAAERCEAARRYRLRRAMRAREAANSAAESAPLAMTWPHRARRMRQRQREDVRRLAIGWLQKLERMGYSVCPS